MLIEVRASLFPSAQVLINFLNECSAMPHTVKDKVWQAEQEGGANRVLGIVDAKFLTDFFEKEGIVYLNLFPDMSRSQYTKNDTFVYAAPVLTDSWLQLQKFARFTNEKVGYLLPDDFRGLDDVIILRSKLMSDDDCMTAQAYIRLVDNIRARVYCVPYRDTLPTGMLANFTAGAPPALCKMVTIDPLQLEGKENDNPQTV